MKQTPNIPLDLCFYAIKNKCVNQLQCYIFLKYNCDGYLSNLEELANQYATETGKTKRTFYNHRKWLIQNGWLMKMKKGGVRVVGYRPLLKVLGFEEPKQKGALMECDLSDFKAFVSAVVVTHVGKVKKYIDNRTGNKNKGIASGRLLGSFNCPLTYLATTLDISKSTAQNIMGYAEKFLRVESVFIPYDKIDSNQLRFHRKYSDEGLHNLVIRNGKVYEQLPTAIWSEIIIKRCRI